MMAAVALDALCDKNGFLNHDQTWTEEIAVAFAAKEGIHLT